MAASATLHQTRPAAGPGNYPVRSTATDGFPTRAQIEAIYGTPRPMSAAAIPARKVSWLRLGAAAVALCVGVFLAGNTMWQLWGSNIMATQRQSELAAQLEASPAIIVPVGVSLSQPATAAQAVPAVAPVVDPGAPVGHLRIDAIGLDTVFVAGTGHDQLTAGPGLMEGTAFPGDAGNSAIAGHRTTYGAPFRELDNLNAGDHIVISVPGRPDAVYEVRDTFIVNPGDVWVATQTSGARLTLTTCHPEGSDRQRLVVQAELISGPAAASAIPADAWQRSQSN